MEKLIVKYGEMLIAEHESKVKKLTIPDVSISLDRAKKYAAHQHYRGTIKEPIVPFEEWDMSKYNLKNEQQCAIHDVRLDDVIDGINECEMKRRWNYIAQIINGVQLNLSDLTEEQKAIIKKYLTDKVSLF